VEAGAVVLPKKHLLVEVMVEKEKEEEANFLSDRQP